MSIMPVVIILSVGTKLSGYHLPHPARASRRLLLLVRKTNLRALPHPLHPLPGPSIGAVSPFRYMHVLLIRLCNQFAMCSVSLNSQV